MHDQNISSFYSITYSCPSVLWNWFYVTFWNIKTVTKKTSRCTSGVLFITIVFTIVMIVSFITFFSIPASTLLLHFYPFFPSTTYESVPDFLAFFFTTSTWSAFSWPTVFPPLSTPTVLLSLIPSQPNPMKRCISYYQSLMNLDLKMEYCPETNLSYEGEKILAEELGEMILGAWADCSCMNILIISIFMIYKYIQIC